MQFSGEVPPTTIIVKSPGTCELVAVFETISERGLREAERESQHLSIARSTVLCEIDCPEKKYCVHGVPFGKGVKPRSEETLPEETLPEETLIGGNLK